MRGAREQNTGVGCKKHNGWTKIKFQSRYVDDVAHVSFLLCARCIELSSSVELSDIVRVGAEDGHLGIVHMLG
jgi:hypothetical protein